MNNRRAVWIEAPNREKYKCHLANCQRRMPGQFMFWVRVGGAGIVSRYAACCLEHAEQVRAEIAEMDVIQGHRWFLKKQREGGA